MANASSLKILFIATGIQALVRRNSILHSIRDYTPRSIGDYRDHMDHKIQVRIPHHKTHIHRNIYRSICRMASCYVYNLENIATGVDEFK